MTRATNQKLDPSHAYRFDTVSPKARFDDVETTISHLFRRRHPALGGRSYGEALFRSLEARGHLSGPGLFELGGGVGSVASAMAGTASAAGRSFEHVLIDLSRRLLSSQRQCAPAALAVAAHAEHLPFADGTVRGLFLANEVIADLRVAPVQDQEAAQLISRYGLDVRNVQRLNVGALRLLEELSRVLARGSSACLIEFGGDFGTEPVELRGDLGRGRHTEHSIHFGHLETVAASLGFVFERILLADLLEIDRRCQVASYPDVVRLRRFVPKLPVLAHPKEELESAHPFLTRVFKLEFPEIGSPRFPDPSARGGLCQLFYALLLCRPS